MTMHDSSIQSILTPLFFHIYVWENQRDIKKLDKAKPITWVKLRLFLVGFRKNAIVTIVTIVTIPTNHDWRSLKQANAAMAEADWDPEQIQLLQSGQPHVTGRTAWEPGWRYGGFFWVLGDPQKCLVYILYIYNYIYIYIVYIYIYCIYIYLFIYNGKSYGSLWIETWNDVENLIRWLLSQWTLWVLILDQNLRPHIFFRLDHGLNDRYHCSQCKIQWNGVHINVFARKWCIVKMLIIVFCH